jgi:hypothetical protein
VDPGLPGGDPLDGRVSRNTVAVRFYWRFDHGVWAW